MKSIFQVADGDPKAGWYTIDGTPFLLAVGNTGAILVATRSGTTLDLLSQKTRNCLTGRRIRTALEARAIGLAIQDWCRS